MRLVSLSPPVTVVLLLWIWLGRTSFGGGGWYLLLIPLYGAVPAGLLLLTQGSVVAHARRTGARIRRAHARVVVALWLALFVGGATLVDFGDAPGSANSVLSLLTRIPAETPWATATFRVATGLAVTAWAAQVVLMWLPAERTHRRRR